MNHKAEVQVAMPFAKIFSDAKEVGNLGFVLLVAALASLAFCFSCSPLQAQEQLFERAVGEPQISVSYFVESIQTSSLFLGHAAETTGFKFREIFSFLGTSQPELTYGQNIRRQAQDGDRSVSFYRKTRSSRYAYQAWADLGTGYGRIFSADSFGRSRTNGVGVEDPDCFYFKMSFKF